MFNWIRHWRVFRRRRQRKYLQKELLFLLRNEHILIPPYFIVRLREYDKAVFNPVLNKWINREKHIWDRHYSRIRDKIRAHGSARFLFLEAVKYAL